jgi:hypothetical protein
MSAGSEFWPVYTITQRKAVETKVDVPIVMEQAFLLTGQVLDELGQFTNEMGVLLFSSVENAERCLGRIGRSDCVIATFRNRGYLSSYLKAHVAQGWRWVIFDRYSNGHFFRIEDFVADVAGQSG